MPTKTRRFDGKLCSVSMSASSEERFRQESTITVASPASQTVKRPGTSLSASKDTRPQPMRSGRIPRAHAAAVAASERDEQHRQDRKGADPVSRHTRHLCVAQPASLHPAAAAPKVALGVGDGVGVEFGAGVPVAPMAYR